MSGRIASIEAWPVNVPLNDPYLFAIGTYRGLSHTVVRITTDDGLTGLGEAFMWRDAAIINELAPTLIGRKCEELRASLGVVDGASEGSRRVLNAYAQSDGVTTERAWAAIEIALWDIAGKAGGKSIAELLGGVTRTEIPVTEYFACRVNRERTPEEIAMFCAQMIADHGSTHFEGKVATMPPDEEMRMLRLVRDAIGPDRELRVDANLGWRPETAISLLPILHELNITGIEEPCGTWADAALLRAHTSIPFSSHEPDFDTAAQLGVPNTLVLSVLSCGGIARTVQTIRRCQEAGLGFWFYSGELGIATAACLQVAAAIPYVGRSQSLLRMQSDDVIADGTPVPNGGFVALPNGPGLGVELDETSLARCTQRFADEGEYVIYDAPPLPRY
jgi:glucarate dehydratase